jgi:thiol-disulfide isomerase/thioredoxin
MHENIMRFAKGKVSPTFENYENFNGGKTSLSDLKGKYVYIDVWATWCAPCKAEIPFLKTLEKEYHGKNIQFVSISVDMPDFHDAWKEMVKKEELGGIQLYADKNFESKFIVDYGINAIPRFILLDPNGNIVDSDAERPSSPKLKELFTELGI